MSRLGQRVSRIERQTSGHAGERRCSVCQDWPAIRALLTEIDADGSVTRQDRLDGPAECPKCGWSPLIYDVDIVEVKDWNRVGRYGID